MGIKIIIPSLIFAGALLFGFQPVKDTDFGWHYRCGKDLLSGHPCLQNDYSYFLPDYKAYNPSFLYDALIAVVYDATGFLGLSVLGAIVIAAAALLLYKLIKGPLWFRTLAPILILITPGPSLVLGLRSQVFSFLFFILTLYLLNKYRHSGKAEGRIQNLRMLGYLYLLPPLFFLWVNTHIGYISGLLLFSGFFIGELFKDVAKVVVFPTAKFIRITIVTALTFLATFINPFGPKVYLEIIRHARAPLGSTIAEWVAPPTWIKVLVLLLTLELIGLLFSRRKLNLFSALTIIIFAILTFTGARNLIFFTTLFFIYTGYAIPTSFPQIFARYPKLQTASQLVLCLILLIFSSFNFRQINRTIDFDTNWESYCNKSPVTYPCQFTSRYKNLTGNIYAMYEWGGFLIWQLPKAKVFADGRTPAWLDKNGYSTYQVLLAVLQTQEGWNEKLEETKTDYILVSPGTFMDILLKERAAQYGWKEEFRDGASVLYVKTKS